MIDTEKIKADIELARKPILPILSVAAQSLVYNARSACVRHAADLLEERDRMLQRGMKNPQISTKDIATLIKENQRLTAQRDAALALCDEWAESWRATGSKGSTLERAAEAMRRALGVTRT